MNSISINEKKYSKASDIARELGYTADYVGQLCRAGKVDAQLVGRSWYVSEDSLRAHKKTRYRNDKKATHRSISQSLKIKDVDAEDSFQANISVATEGAQHGYAGKKFYSRAPQKVKHDYFDDNKELIPTSPNTKDSSGKLSVSYADAKAVKVTSNSKEYDFDPTPRKEIRFSGPLSISEADEVVEEEILEEVRSKDVLTQKIQVHAKAKKKTSAPARTDGSKTIKVRHQRKDIKKKHRKLPLEHNIDGVVGMTAERISDRNPVGGTLKVAVPSDHASVSRFGAYVVTASVLVSVILSVFIVGLESVIEVSEATMVTSYFFDLQTLLAAVSEAW